MLEQKLLNEINRYKSINRNASSLYVTEQELPTTPPSADDMLPALPEPTDDAEMGAATDEPLDTTLPSTIGEPEDESTEEVDVTDLVNMTKNIKNDLETSKGENSSVMQKMDDVFSKLGELEQKLAQMDGIISKIDQLGATIEASKPKTEVEKLEMRSLDSYPFNQKPQEFFAQKQGEMRASGKNEYILTKNDIENYSKDDIENTFNPLNDESKY